MTQRFLKKRQPSPFLKVFEAIVKDSGIDLIIIQHKKGQVAEFFTWDVEFEGNSRRLGLSVSGKLIKVVLYVEQFDFSPFENTFSYPDSKPIFTFEGSRNLMEDNNYSNLEMVIKMLREELRINR